MNKNVNNEILGFSMWLSNYVYLNVCKQMTDVKLLLLYSNTSNPFNCVETND